MDAFIFVIQAAIILLRKRLHIHFIPLELLCLIIPRLSTQDIYISCDYQACLSHPRPGTNRQEIILTLPDNHQAYKLSKIGNIIRKYKNAFK